MKKADIILIAALLLAAGALFLAFSAGEGGAYVIVAVDGVETERHSLSEDGTFPLNGGTNILVIEEGTARLTEASCPDLICVRQGRISRTGQCITCLPNHLTVTVYGAGEQQFDIMVG